MWQDETNKHIVSICKFVFAISCGKIQIEIHYTSLHIFKLSEKRLVLQVNNGLAKVVTNV